MVIASSDYISGILPGSRAESYYSRYGRLCPLYPNEWKMPGSAPLI